MRYWWVNQNQTFKHEFLGGYLWSPKRKANDHVNPFYESMREVSPGDVVLSFAGSEILAAAIAVSHAYECPKPDDFGNVGQNWSQVGWKVDCIYHLFRNPIRPADHMDVLGPRLPNKYKPLQANGHGLQGVYLTEVFYPFADAVATLVGRELKDMLQGTRAADEADILSARSAVEWEEQIRRKIEADTSIDETEKTAIVLARRGQGKFKENVRKIEAHCRITKVDRIEHLRASHCKPWRDSTNEERLSGENGLLLTPTIDHLFDRGFISFEDRGRVLISPVAHRPSLERMGIRTNESINVGTFTEGQREFLDWHRERVFLESRIRR